MARSEKNLTAVFTDTASAIRAKTNTTENICPLDFADKINSIQTGGGGMKAFFDAGGKCAYSDAKTFNDSIKYSDTENVTNAYKMFYICSDLVEAPNIDTSNITNMESMFDTCTQLTKVPQLNTSKARKMNYMFYYCANLKEIPMIDTSSVNYMSNMFGNCTSLKTIPNLDTSWAYDTSYMFQNDEVLIEVPSLNLRRASNMDRMFWGCRSLTTVNELQTLNGASYNGMFGYCSNLLSVPLLVTDKNKSVDMAVIFYNCSKLTSIPAIDARFVTNLDSAFDGCSSLETIHMKDIHVSFNISASTKFTRNALLEIINNLHTIVPTSATPIQTLTMGETNLAKLTDEDKAIATNKGWTLA